jgi:hypothetical protein
VTALNISTRIRFVNEDGTLTPEAYRSLDELVSRSGGALGSSGGDTFIAADYSSVEGQQSAGGDITGDTFGQAEAQAMGEMLQQPVEALPLPDTTAQPATLDAPGEMVMQPASEPRCLDLPQHTTANAPTYKKGRLYFDLTLNKARIGGATAYETLTSV